MKPLRKIKLNRDLGRKGSTETPASDRAPLVPEKTTTSDRSTTANISEGDRPSSTPEGTVRKERSASAERGVSRERPGSAGERLQGSDKEQDRSSGLDRARDRASGSDRERDRGLGSEREKERVSGSQKMASIVERDAEGERSVRTDRKNSSGGSGSGRSVSLDKMTIAEKSARRQVDHQEKPNVSSKERGEGTEQAAKSDRSVTCFPAAFQAIHIHDPKKA